MSEPTSHSWMSHSNYGGEEKGNLPKEHINYGEKNQNMQGDIKEDTLEQPEKAQPSDTSSYSIGTKRGDVKVSDDLQQRVIEVLQQDSFVEDANITINIKENNCVELCGSVPDRKMIDRAIRLVHGLGISNIDNDLIVRPLDT